MKRRRAAAALAAMALVAALAGAQVPDGVEAFDAAWTLVRDSHFDKSMNGVDWDAVRTELRPRAAAASSVAELRAVIRVMLGRLGLSHFALVPSTADVPGPEGDLGANPGLDVRLVDHSLLVTRVEPGLADVHPGWRLMKIGPTDVSDQSPAAAADNPRLAGVEAWRVAQSLLRGPAGSKVDIVFEDGRGQLQPRTLERWPDQGQPVTVGSLPTMFVRVDSARRRTPGGATAGVIAFNVWMPAVDARFQKAMDDFRGADGIVIDLRGNPGGLAAMIMGISGHFFTGRLTLGVMKTRDAELRFVTNPRLVNASGERVAPFSGPVAILVDGMSGSASECFAGGMQSLGRARIFGQPSMGQALPALFDRLPNGDLLIHAYGDFVTSNGRRLEGRGVIPDESQPLRRGDLLAGRDRPLDAALAWIDREKGAPGGARP